MTDVQPTPVPDLVDQLLTLGVTPGGLLLVHTAFSKIKPVDGGPLGLIAALRSVIGPAGTLVMPSMSDDDERPFEPRATPCVGMGIVADTFWRMPDVLRSDSPHAFAAIGPEAASITADHPWDVPHGLDSPVGRVHELDGQVLLLGVGHDGNTTIHLAEALAEVRYRCPKFLTLLKDGRHVRVSYDETDHCCARFALVDEWLDALGAQRYGVIGHGRARLARSRDIVTTARGRLLADETVFLHEPGIDSECDQARASIPGGEHVMAFELTEGAAILERTPAVFRALLGGLPDHWTSCNEGPDTFSPFDNLGHLIHGERTDWIPRARIILEQGAIRRFEPYDRFAQVRESAGKSLEELLNEFATLRAANLVTLRGWNLTEQQFRLEGEHPALGTVTLCQLLATWVAHDLGHIAQTTRVMAKRYRDDVGPWREYLPVMDR